MSLPVKRRKAAAASIALMLAAVAASMAPVPAQAQWAVFDASNFSQNVLTAARTLQQVNNQIQSLQHQAQMILNQGQMLVNQGKNLTGLATSPLAMLQQDVQRTQQLITQAQGLATQVAQLDQQFGRQYPMSYNATTPSSQMVADAQTRWANSPERAAHHVGHAGAGQRLLHHRRPGDARHRGRLQPGRGRHPGRPSRPPTSCWLSWPSRPCSPSSSASLRTEPRRAPVVTDPGGGSGRTGHPPAVPGLRRELYASPPCKSSPQ